MRKALVRFTRSPEEAWLVGTLAEDRGRVFFEYAPEFLARGLSLSPLRLPFQSGLFEHQDRAFGPLPGLFDDSLPDGWGLLLMDRHFRRLGLQPAAVGPLERLAWLGTRTMGALTYHPPTERGADDASAFDLHALARHSLEVLSGAAAEVLPQLLRAGGSPGGARPKVLVGLDRETGELASGEDDLPERYERWMVKFGARADQPHAGAVEHAYALLAGAAGVDMPATRLFETAEGDRFFGVKRFDRHGNRRFHVHTFGNLLQANFRVPCGDYGDLLKVTHLLTRNHQDVLRAFRRMVFNVLAHNRDDHVKNFAFILDDVAGEWSLSPAYDLQYSHGLGGEHTMTVAGEGRTPERSHMLRVAELACVSRKAAGGIIAEVEAATARWPELAAAAGVPESCLREISSAIVPRRASRRRP